MYMPSSPKVLKETILEAAFEMLVQEGYESINIKTLAAKLGCSTQPISRQFGSMDGLREELLEYCLARFSKAFSITGEQVADVVLGVAQGYIQLAFDYPNVYKYLYMSGQDGKQMGLITRSQRAENYGKVIQMLMQEYDITEAAAYGFMLNMEYYVHGIASYIAADYVNESKEEVLKKLEEMRDLFLEHAKIRMEQ